MVLVRGLCRVAVASLCFLACGWQLPLMQSPLICNCLTDKVSGHELRVWPAGWNGRRADCQRPTAAPQRRHSRGNRAPLFELGFLHRIGNRSLIKNRQHAACLCSQFWPDVFVHNLAKFCSLSFAAEASPRWQPYGVPVGEQQTGARDARDCSPQRASGKVRPSPPD